MNRGISNGNKKIAISIEEPLLAEIENLAEEMNVSRSRIFTLAARKYINEYNNKHLFDELNTVYHTDADESEKTVRDLMKQKHFYRVESW